MRFDTEMDRRLNNWARHRLLREDGGRVASAEMAERVDGAGWDAPTVVSIIDAEADETHAGVMQLESVLRYATEVWYLGGGGVKQRCRKANVTETVLRTRVANAQRKLGQWLQDKREAADRERNRVERLQRGVLGVVDLR